ncbi:MAG: type I-U CRISPR-associated helicase/endonuclease Cas3, partial [Bryobacteraceae bacterium]
MFPQYSASRKPPFAWQGKLFEQFLSGEIPGELSIPTGLGKTSVMQVWLLSLAWQRTCSSHRTCPTRLVWVVDRRAVVDQATDEANAIAERLKVQAPDDCDPVRKSIPKLAVSTLRGGLADNREWSEDPSRPAIIIGTVDMVGSRLLFSGYGDSRRARAYHAALVGQDSLIVNDEAHLTPVFAELLRQVAELSTTGRPMRSMRLSATPRSTVTAPDDFCEDLQNPEFIKRFYAAKRLTLVESPEPKKEIERLAADPLGRTIVFVRSPEDAKRIANVISTGNNNVVVTLLTGVQRARERDELFDREATKPFISPSAAASPCWLVATSAGEVGVNLSCDRMVTDLDTADHLLQRFGRLNRFGETQGAAVVVYSSKEVTGEKPDAVRRKRTLDYLRALPDISPSTLHSNPPPPEALSATPKFGPLLPWLIDVWSMTSIDSRDWRSRPRVGAWLRGDEESAPPETHVIWREDVRDLVHSSVTQADREEVFECYRPLPHELLKAVTGRLCVELAETNYLDDPAILIGPDRSIKSGTIEQLLGSKEDFKYATLVLPPGIGDLDDQGMVSWSKRRAALSAGDLLRYDVSADQSQRMRLGPGQELDFSLAEYRLVCTVEVERDDVEDAAPVVWRYFRRRPEAKVGSSSFLLEEHTSDVVHVVKSLTSRLGFGSELLAVFEWAAQHHDLGKDRPLWQKAAGRQDGSAPVAKCNGEFKPRLLDGYRHEVGSLLDAASTVPSEFTEFQRDVGFHLIA